MTSTHVRWSRWLSLVIGLGLAASLGFALGHNSRNAADRHRALASSLPTVLAAGGTATTGDPISMQYGAIQGESTAPGHRNWITLSSWSFPEIVSTGAGTTSGKRQHMPLTITKEVDRASPAFLSDLANNETVKTVVLQAAQTAKTGEQDFLTISLANVIVDSISEHSSGGRPVDTITLDFTRLDYRYVYYQGTKRTSYDFCWDFKAGADCSAK